MKKRSKRPATQKLAKASSVTREKLPLIEHLKELRRRLFYVAACVAVGASITYGLERRLIEVLLKPSHGQDFIYTSPMGGMNFLFAVCFQFGLVFATPVIIYQILAFIQPLMRDTTRKFLLFASAACGIVAILGILFGYFLGLPQALHFLLHQFVTVQVRPLITIQSYMQFVALYLLGSALMFQIPLILLFINRIKPLKPKTLFKYERHLIVAAVVIAFIMNPSPNIVDQLFVVLPIIVTYQVGIFLVWMVNHGKDYELLAELRAKDALRQAERAAKQLVPFRPAPLEPELAVDPIPIDTYPEPVPPAEPEPITYSPTPVVERPSEQGQRVRPRTYATAQPMRRSYLPLRGHIIQ